MNKRSLASIALLAYGGLLIKLMVFKDLPTIRIGHMMFHFGGTHANQPANFIPFATIASYLLGHKGILIGGINIIGNIALLVPVGFLVPMIFPGVRWRTCLIPALASGLTIEILQTILNVGVFDIDDVILNGLGVMLGFWLYLGLQSLSTRKSR